MASLNTTNLELRLEQVIALLREANDEYNWDPATFAVTVVIGAIATLLTVLAIGQGLLAAGPGRLKSGHYAVGPWSETQKTRFAWGEWRFRTTVETPIIRLLRRREGWFRTSTEQDSDIDIDIDHGPSLAVPNRFSIHDRFRRLYYKFQFLRLEAKSKRYSEYFPATWLKLLTVLHLDSPKLWDGERLGADYIPSDLPAAQAYGSIKDVSILTLMCADGAAVVRQDSVNGLPFVQGKSRTSVTLSFRDHPLLGIAGSLSTFDTRDTWERDVLSSGPGRDSRKLQHLSNSLDYAFGRVVLSGRAGTARLYGAPTYYDAFFLPEPDFWHCPLAWSMYRKDLYPRYELGLGDVDFPGRGCVCCRNEPSRTAPSWQGPVGNTSVPLRDNEGAWQRLLALAMTGPPDASPPAFPIAGANLLDMLALFATQSTTWNMTWNTGISRSRLQPTSHVEMATLLNRGPSQWVDTRQAGNKPTLQLDESVLRGCFQLTSDLVLRRIADGTSPGLYFKHLPSPGDANVEPGALFGFRKVTLSIQFIDYWVLARQDSMSEWFRTACVMSEIASSIEALAQEMLLIRGNDLRAAEEWESAKRRVLEDPLLKMNLHAKDISVALEALLGSWDFGEPLPRPVDLPGCVLADLMVYRIALIVVALTAWSADSTMLLDDKYDRIVPIL